MPHGEILTHSIPGAQLSHCTVSQKLQWRTEALLDIDFLLHICTLSLGASIGKSSHVGELEDTFLLSASVWGTFSFLALPLSTLSSSWSCKMAEPFIWSSFLRVSPHLCCSTSPRQFCRKKRNSGGTVPFCRFSLLFTL